ncbi:hypothetical protein Zm00014a_029016 [Zea mays]|uniref:Uncharacterized protein n=1 Tax=Zea mays TaxID=4577 RepID=A0A3L6F7M2_MAIZE|nr:hypothetical protein Zm00014a_029016 [Zea mays]
MVSPPSFHGRSAPLRPKSRGWKVHASSPIAQCRQSPNLRVRATSYSALPVPCHAHLLPHRRTPASQPRPEMVVALCFPGVTRKSLSGRARRRLQARKGAALGPREREPRAAMLERRRGLAVRCQTGSTAAPFVRTEEAPAAAAGARNALAGFTFVMKFGSSSLASAERMWEAREKAVSCGGGGASEIPELAVIMELHLRTIDEPGLDKSIVSGMLLFAPLCSWNASAVPLALS